MRYSNLFALSCAFGLAGCWKHSFPTTDKFIAPVEAPASWPDTVQLFVDANGTFYPAGWSQQIKRAAIRKSDSLLNASAGNERLRQFIESDEVRQLSQIAAFGRTKQRIFILVHGYNNTEPQAETPYMLIESKLDLHQGDGIVRFFWDGLTGSGIGPAKIWFNAAGNSQLAGSRCLRRVLDQFSDKDVYIIAHSRGTSVTLSALGNPIYDPSFFSQSASVAKSWGPAYTNFLAPVPLAERGNRIHVIAMAPSVDRIDFCDASQQPARAGPFRCALLRKFTPQLKSFRHTINPADPVLRKFIGLSGNFNPTGLGQNSQVGAELRQTYAFLHAYPFRQPAKFHLFRLYVEHPTFIRMLKDEHVGKL